jgi:hypothetical protein
MPLSFVLSQSKTYCQGLNQSKPLPESLNLLTVGFPEIEESYELEENSKKQEFDTPSLYE